jgi:hypothetical protein
MLHVPSRQLHHSRLWSEPGHAVATSGIIMAAATLHRPNTHSSRARVESTVHIAIIIMPSIAAIAHARFAGLMDRTISGISRPCAALGCPLGSITLVGRTHASAFRVWLLEITRMAIVTLVTAWSYERKYPMANPCTPCRWRFGTYPSFKEPLPQL